MTTTPNDLADVHFAELYIDYVARRHSNDVTRAKAKVLMATMAMLDTVHPTWRIDLVAELNRLGMRKEVDKIFTLPSVDPDSLFSKFLLSVTESKPYDSNHGSL